VADPGGAYPGAVALLLAVSSATINWIVAGLTRHELSEGPGDLIATHLLRLAHDLTGSAVLFAAAYLLLHGMVKVVLVAALLRNRVCAYPWMIVFLIVFIGYQLYRIALHPTLGLTALIVFDAFIARLTWRECKQTDSDLARPDPIGAPVAVTGHDSPTAGRVTRLPPLRPDIVGMTVWPQGVGVGSVEAPIASSRGSRGQWSTGPRRTPRRKRPGRRAGRTAATTATVRARCSRNALNNPLGDQLVSP